jgi:hypothetical protein
MSDRNDAATGAAEGQAGAGQTVRVRFDDTGMGTHYANVANVGMSRDEVTLLFGTNQTWGAVESEIAIKLSARIIMTPSVARNLVETLQRVLADYDQKVGRSS